MADQRRTLGRMGENLALAHLQNMGYKILIQNYRIRLGELDIIADDAGTLVFVEVKARIGQRGEWPFESITQRKQRQLSKVALEFISQHQLQDKPARFDVVGVLFDATQPLLLQTAKCQVIKNAFDLCYGI